MIWQNIPCHVCKYFATSLAYFFGINNGLVNMGLVNIVFHYGLLWGFKDKRKQKHAFHHPWCNQYFECLGLLERKYKIFRVVEMGGNYMVEKYLMKLNFKIFKYLPNMCWNGNITMILYIRRDTWKHVMTIKSFIVGIGLNGNKFMNIIIIYSLKQNQYTFHGNWNPKFLHSSRNNCKVHEWQNHNWFDAEKLWCTITWVQKL